MSAQIGVIGAGAWGTALAAMLASDGSRVLLWARSPGLAADINHTRTNAAYLAGTRLPVTIQATSDPAAFSALPVLLVAVPAQHMGDVLAQWPVDATTRDLVLCAKGIQAGTGRLMIDVAQEWLAQHSSPAQIAVLSGPTFAREVALGLPTAVTLACAGGEEQWHRLSPLIARTSFRPYYSNDVIGAEIGGALKNVLAIACGVVDGLGLGENARAALIARGFAEMLRFGTARGGRPETLAGLSGFGDVVLTCTSMASRNYTLGKALGEGQSMAQAWQGKASVVEGAATAPVLAELARAAGIDMPIVDAVCRLLDGAPPSGDVRAIVSDLLTRSLKAEHGGEMPARGGIRAGPTGAEGASA